MSNFQHHPSVEKLLALGLHDEDYVVAGSGPLFARGLIESISDLDVVARGEAWVMATRLGHVCPAPFGGAYHVVLYDMKLEVLDRWFPWLWSLDYLIETAETIHGVRFVSLDVVRAAKAAMNRPKDVLHVAIIDEYVAAGGR